MTTTDLSKLTPKEMAAHITGIFYVRWQQRRFIDGIIALMDAHIITGDYKYWNDVLENL